MRKLPAFIWLENAVPKQIVARSDDLVAMSYLAESGQGLALLPDDQRRAGIERIFTFLPGQTSDLWLLTHPELRNMLRVQLVMHHLAKCFSEEPRI